MNKDLFDFGVAVTIVRYLRRRARQLEAQLENPETDFFDAEVLASEVAALRKAEEAVKDLVTINWEQFQNRRS